MAKTVLQQEREDRRRREYRRLILEAAERVIDRQGLTGTTMDDVAREAECSKATLYQYFPSKTGLQLELLGNFFDEFARGIKKIREGRGSAGEKLRAGIRFYLEYHQKKENIGRMLWLDREFRDKMAVLVTEERRKITAADLEFLDGLKVKRRESLDGAARIIRQGMAAGEFRELDVPSTVTFIEALLQGFCHLRSWQERSGLLPEAADAIYEFILKGLERPARRPKGEPR